jgi:hypothetical protein
MRPTGAISASDCPFRGAGRQLFSKKRHPDSGKRPFQPYFGDMAHCMHRKKTTFSNDTVADLWKYRLVARLPLADQPVRR